MTGGSTFRFKTVQDQLYEKTTGLEILTSEPWILAIKTSLLKPAKLNITKKFSSALYMDKNDLGPGTMELPHKAMTRSRSK